eukprot:CAMPEP_0171309254 /NCGR_PEP_ID=MMETSP0816-20121228/19416_1 /TAXON_ID=420281 /ORGANISM="Proboscia inermis, Strain CCAP1064/1" /LENGTH=386 /DNA_ID=CAMNT_0011792673 /DNA_START=897 /DNA_END=2057 /DNA_ORIENTATION=+
MLGVIVILLVLQTITVSSVPTIELSSTKSRPNLELPVEYHYHLFLSHIWSSGQDKAHKIVRMLQLLVPGIKIWVDVDELKDMKELEQAVTKCAIFVLFYSEGYFGSKNCRRELYEAIEEDKTIILVYEGDDRVLKKIKNECFLHCTEGPGPSKILDAIFSTGPVLWLGGSMQAFLMESVKLLCLKIFCHMPYYKKSSNLLDAGLRVGTELGALSNTSPLRILYSNANSGAHSIAAEIKEMPNKGHIFVEEVESILVQSDCAPEGYTEKVIFLLYLNDETFCDGEDLQEVMKFVLKQNISIALVYEQDISKGGCPFSSILEHTPKELLDPPYMIYKSIAVPIYSIPEYRRVSLNTLLYDMGGRQLLTLSSFKSTIRSIAMYLKEVME